MEVGLDRQQLLIGDGAAVEQNLTDLTVERLAPVVERVSDEDLLARDLRRQSELPLPDAVAGQELRGSLAAHGVHDHPYDLAPIAPALVASVDDLRNYLRKIEGTLNKAIIHYKIGELEEQLKRPMDAEESYLKSLELAPRMRARRS